MDKKLFRKFVLLGCVLVSAVAGKVRADGQRPNILWIVAEDIGCDMACYGTKGVQTPNLDRLASEGALYLNAFTTASVCSPSRSSFMTGLYPTQVYSQNMRIRPPLVKKNLPDDVNIFTKYIRDAGYFIGLCGHQKKDWGFADPVLPPYDTSKWSELVGKQPFFCQYQFYATHRPFLACKEHPVGRAEIELHPYTADIPEAREELGQYLEHINLLDMQVGELIAQLKADGLYDNTIIVFSGDNGPPVLKGKGFLYERGIAMPLIVRAPKRFNPGFKPGAVIDELVSAMDFAPTFTHLAGGVVPAYMEGRIFFGKDRQAEPEYLFALRDRADMRVDIMRSVRSKRYKYIRNFVPEMTYYASGHGNVMAAREMAKLFRRNKLPPEQAAYFETKPNEELYDLKIDPFELRNLAGDPKHREILQTLRSALDQWIVDTNDEGRLLEDPLLLQELDRRFQEVVKKRREKNK